jgi:hypothetical protein
MEGSCAGERGKNSRASVHWTGRDCAGGGKERAVSGAGAGGAEEKRVGGAGLSRRRFAYFTGCSSTWDKQSWIFSSKPREEVFLGKPECHVLGLDWLVGGNYDHRESRASVADGAGQAQAAHAGYAEIGCEDVEIFPFKAFGHWDVVAERSLAGDDQRRRR